MSFPPFHKPEVLYICNHAQLAQLVELFFDVERVRGSSPLLRTKESTITILTIY